MKKLILTILVVCLLPLASFGQSNPVNMYKWIKTANDTITLGLSGYKTLTVKNCGTAAGDTISVYIPDQYGAYSGYAFTIGRQVSKRFTYSGSGFIVKSSSDSLMINYYTGAVDVEYDNSNGVINTVNYKDTLKAGSTLVSHLFDEQYRRIEVSVKYDSAAVGNDTLRLKHVSKNGDTTTVYVLDTLTGARQGYIVNVGDMQYHSFRIDKWCPYILIFEYSDAIIHTTKFMTATRGVKD